MQACFLQRPPFLPRRKHFFLSGSVPQLYCNALEVAVQGGDTIALRADLDLKRLNPILS